MKFDKLSQNYRNELITYYKDWECINEAEQNYTRQEIVELIKDNEEDYLIVLDKYHRESLITREEWLNDEDGYYMKILEE